MKNSDFSDYYTALDRLKRGEPIRIAKGTRITNDAVSVEAGRKKGSIKKSRAAFGSLILAIDEAAKCQSGLEVGIEHRLKEAKDVIKDLRQQLDNALSREMSLLYELLETKKVLSSLTGKNVLPIRGGKGIKSGSDDSVGKF